MDNINKAKDYYEKALAYENENNLAEAIQNYSEAIRLNPGIADFYIYKASALMRLNKDEDAIINLNISLRNAPVTGKTFNYLGIATDKLGRFCEAIIYYKKAIELEPFNIDFHRNLACVFLKTGNFAEGWPEYEWSRVNKRYNLGFAEPEWQGDDLEGKTLYVYTEQGFGDAIQFIRFLPLLRKNNGKIILRCPPELNNIFKTIREIDILSNNDLNEPPLSLKKEKIPFDYFISLLSLPRVLDINESDLPGKIPYIFVEEKKNIEWQEKLKNINGPKVGIVWETGGDSPTFSVRSCPFNYFYNLAEKFPHIKFINLQQGIESRKKFVRFPRKKNIVNLAEQIKDFADTGAIINNIDLLISVDTAAAHLSGALSKNTLVLLDSYSDWRWQVERNDSPWYPTMKLIRQNSYGNWSSVFSEIENVIKNNFSNFNKSF